MMNNRENKGSVSVAIQGGLGSFHEIAALEYFGNRDILIIPCDTFEELFHKLDDGTVDCAVVAFENSVAGSILKNYHMLRKSGLPVIGEIYLRIVQNLVALPGQTVDDIREIHSHPIAIQQCSVFLDKMRRKGVKVVETIDTALSAKWISETGNAGCGAIASATAASMYGLGIIKREVEDDRQNFTRFLLISGKDINHITGRSEVTNPDKSLVCFSLPHRVGSLSQVLSVLAFYSISLTKIQSLPIVGKPWEYQFHIDLVFSDYDRYRLALDAIRPLTENLEVLGEYTQGTMPSMPVNKSGKTKDE